MKKRIIIIGGGVIGCACAYYLSKQGMAVTLLERGKLGGQASGAAAGLFSFLKPMAKEDAYTRLLFASYEHFQQLVPGLQAVSGVDLEYERCGTLRTILHSKRLQRLQPWLASCRVHGWPVELLSRSETYRREPQLAEDVYGALWFVQEGQVRALSVVEAYARAAQRQGAVLCEGREVSALRSQGRRVVGVVTSEGELTCEQLIIASGAWAAQSGVWLQLDVPIVPQKGQMLALRQPAQPLRHIIIGRGVYIAPKRDGTLIVGATREDVGFDTSVTEEGSEGLRSAALGQVPILAQSTIERRWAGLRPRTPDSYPIVGRAPGWENVVLAVGHHSSGVLLSASTGQAVEALIAKGEVDELFKPFGIERFSQKR